MWRAESARGEKIRIFEYGLSHLSILIWHYLHALNGEGPWPGYDNLAKVLRVSKEDVKQSVEELSRFSLFEFLDADESFYRLVPFSKAENQISLFSEMATDKKRELIGLLIRKYKKVVGGIDKVDFGLFGRVLRDYGPKVAFQAVEDLEFDLMAAKELGVELNENEIRTMFFGKLKWNATATSKKTNQNSSKFRRFEDVYKDGRLI